MPPATLHDPESAVIAPGGADDSLTSRTAWLLLAKVLALAFTYAQPLLLVRLLSQVEFGLYKQVMLLIQTAVVLLPFGFHMSLYYFLPRERDPERRQQVVFNVLLVNAVMGGLASLLLFLRPALLGVLFNNPEMTYLAPRLGLVVLTWMVSSFLESAAIANGEARLASGFILFSQCTRAFFLLGAVLVFASIEALVWAAILQGALQTAALLVYLRVRFGPFWRGFRWSALARQLAYEMPLGAGAVVLLFYSQVDNYFVSYRLGAAAYAIYSVGCFNLPLVGMISDAVGSVMIPRVSELQQKDNRREIVMLTARMIRKLAAIYFPLYALLLVTGQEFITLLFTRQYLASWPIFAINLTWIPLALVTSAYDPVIRANPEHRFFLLKVRLALLIGLLFALWFNTRQFGMLGAITTAMGMSVIERVVVACRMGRVLGITRADLGLLDGVLRLALAAAAAGIVTGLTRAAMVDAGPLKLLGASTLLFSLVYAAAVCLLRVPTPEEWRAVQRRREQFQRRLPFRQAFGLARTGRALLSADKGD